MFLGGPLSRLELVLSSPRLTRAEDPKFQGLRPDSRFQPISGNLGTRPLGFPWNWRPGLGFHCGAPRGRGVAVPKFREWDYSSPTALSLHPAI